MARWAARLPAWARVVPRAEKKRVGGGERVGMVLGQVWGVVEMWRWSFEGVGEGRG